MDVFDLFAKISLDTSEYESGLSKASSKLKGFASGMEKGLSGAKSLFEPAVEGFKKIESVGQKAGDVMMKGVKGFMAASTAVAGFGGSAVKAGMSFDSAMSQVSAVSGATGSSFDALRKKAIEMGAKTQFSATEAAEAMNYMAMAGWKTEDMLNGISGIMNLAAASGEDLASTSDIVTDALTAFGMKAEESGHFADILAVASSNANTNVGMMGETFKYMAPVAGALGYSAEDTALSIGLIANSGIKASQAGTSLRSIITRLSTDAGASSKSLGALGVLTEELGVQFYNTDGTARALSDVIMDSREAWKGLSKEQQINYAKTIAGQEAMSAWLALMNAAPSDVDKLTGSIENCNGAAEKMAATMMDNLAGDIKLFKSALESLQITVSDALNPTLREFTQFGTKAMEQLTMGFQEGGTDGFFSALTGIVSNAVTFLAEKAPEFAKVSMKFVLSFANGILDSKEKIIESAKNIFSILIGGLDSWLENNVSDIKSFASSLITVLFNGFIEAGELISKYVGDFIPLIAAAFLTYHEALFTVGIEILGAIGRGLVESKDEIMEMASNTVRNIALAIGENAPAIIDGAIVLLDALANAFMENWPLIAAVGAEIIGKLVEGISSSTPAFVGAIGLLLPHILGIIDKIGSIGGIIGKVINFVTGGDGIGKVLSIGKTLMSGISGLFSLITAHPIIAVITAIVGALIYLWNNCEEFREAVIAIWDAIVSFFQAAGEAIKAAWSGIVEFFQGVWDGIVQVFQNVGQWFADIFTAAWEGIQAVWSAVVGFFQGVWDGIVKVFQGVAKWFGDIFSKAWQAIKSVWDAVAGFFSGIAEGIRSVFSNVTEALAGFFREAWNVISGIWNAAVNFFQGIWQAIQGIFSVVAEVLGGFFSAAWDAVTGVWEAATGFFKGIWDGIVGVFRGVAEWFGNLFKNAWKAITDAWNGVTDFFQGIWEDIKGVFANVWDTFKEIGGNLLKGLWEGVSGAFGWVKEKISGVVSGIIGLFTGKDGFDEHSPSKVFAKIGENVMYGLENGAGNGLGSVQAQMLKTVETMKEAFASTAQMFTQIGQTIMDALSNALGGAIQNINAQMVKTVTVMQMAFAGLSGMFSAIGTNAMNSLVGSMESGIGYLQSRVAALMNSIAAAARAALGIHSPSKVFAAMGENMALGIEKGWIDEFGSVKRDISSSLNFQLTPTPYRPAGGASSGEWPGQRGAIGRGDTTVIINSPVAVDAVQAAREWKKTSQQIAIGYI